MEPDEIKSDYELNTGQAIVRRFGNLDPLRLPAVLVAGHAPFCWGESVGAAAHTAVVLEELARMAYLTLTIRADTAAISEALHHKHFHRKHGPDAYYGQR